MYGEGENDVRSLKGELKQQKHKWNVQNMRKGRRQTFRFGKVGSARIHGGRWLAALWKSPRAKRARRCHWATWISVSAILTFKDIISCVPKWGAGFGMWTSSLWVQAKAKREKVRVKLHLVMAPHCPGVVWLAGLGRMGAIQWQQTNKNPLIFVRKSQVHSLHPNSFPSSRKVKIPTSNFK